uniref:glycoside hydrolase family 11 protein n=1 Tax=Ruminococcus sp. TaxID=41978 RepID=UPI0025F5749C
QGWMSNALAKFHIVEAWASWQPPGENAEKLGSVIIGDTTYDLSWSIHVGQTFDGRGYNYPMYWSVARRDQLELNTTNHLERTIDVDEHLRAWASAGLDLGYLYDIKFGIDAYKSNGSAKLISMDTHMDMATEELFEKYKVHETYERHDPLPVGNDGQIIMLDFETENDKVGCNSESTAKLTKDAFFSGEQSLNICCGKKGSSAFYYELDPYDLPTSTDGNAARFQTGARIYADKDTSFKVYLYEYNDEEILPQNKTYHIGKRICKAGQWTNIRGLFFDFQHDNFRNYSIIFNADDTNVDFYIDDFFISSAGSADDTSIQTFEAEKRGDLNDDGTINSFDLVICRKALLTSTGNSLIEDGGDVNGDFRTNVSDLVLLTKYVLGVSDEIPLTENEAVLLTGDNIFRNTDIDRTLEISALRQNDDTVSTIVRRDGTFTAEWNRIADYTCGSYTEYDEYASNYCKDFDINYYADISSTNDIDVFLGGSVREDNQWIGFEIHECFKWNSYAKSYISEAIDSGKYETVTVNGVEYYMNKEYRAGKISNLYFYRKDDPIKNSDSYCIENKYNLSDFLEKCSIYNEEIACVTKIGMYVESYNSNGYADFKELSFAK